MKYICVTSLVFMQSCYASIDDEIAFLNVVEQWRWKSIFSNTLRGNKELNKENKWIQDSYYDESVYCVIPQALADCKMEMGEFADMDREDFEIVEFDVKPWDLKNGYTRANWNAVILWNYISEINSHNIVKEEYKDDDECIDKIGDLAHDYYEARNAYNLDIIKDSVNDIKAYVKVLGNVFREFDEYYPSTPCGFDEETKSGGIQLRSTCFVLEQNEYGESEITLNIENGKIESCEIYGGVLVQLNDKLEVTEVKKRMSIFEHQILNDNNANKLRKEAYNNRMQILRNWSALKMLYEYIYLIEKQEEYYNDLKSLSSDLIDNHVKFTKYMSQLEDLIKNFIKEYTSGKAKNNTKINTLPDIPEKWTKALFYEEWPTFKSDKEKQTYITDITRKMLFADDVDKIWKALPELKKKYKKK